MKVLRHLGVRSYKEGERFYTQAWREERVAREVIELKSRDQKVVTTSLQGEDGNWMTLVTINARRKK